MAITDNTQTDIALGTTFLDNAGLKQKSKKKKFVEKNKADVELYGKTYRLLEDETLKKNFESKSQDTAAAMLIATKQAADNGVILSETDPKKMNVPRKSLQVYLTLHLQILKQVTKSVHITQKA